LLPETTGELARWLAQNARDERRPVLPTGGRTGLRYGRVPVAHDASRPVEPVCLGTSRLSRVVDYPARDMTITVEAGVRVADLQRTLSAEGQRLAVDLPHPERATIGGALAVNAAGPRRYGLGTLRDYLIGVSAVDGRGRTFKAGGRVVKNVAGYDLCKLLVGSLGTLAVITQVTLKLKPLPEGAAWLWCVLPDWKCGDAVLERLVVSAARPVALELLSEGAAASVAAETGEKLPTDAPVLAVGLEGTTAEVDWQVQTLCDEIRAAGVRQLTRVDGAAAAVLWTALTEYRTTAEEPLTFKANLRPSRVVEFLEGASRVGARVQAHAGNGIVWGHLPDGVTSATAARTLLEPLLAQARGGGGNLLVVDCDPAWKTELPVFGAPEAGVPLMARLKQKFDPDHLLNPGRFLPGL
jgi:glycolate oxidase FAD binding subunit